MRDKETFVPSKAVLGEGEKSPPPGDPRFHKLLREIGELHDRKQLDYGTKGDPLNNIRGSAAWGIPPWVGAMIRANDKVKRLQKFAQEGTLANEAARDSFLDLATYALLALVLFEEDHIKEAK